LTSFVKVRLHWRIMLPCRLAKTSVTANYCN
jgi:hypothetical protein